MAKKPNEYDDLSLYNATLTRDEHNGDIYWETEEEE